MAMWDYGASWVAMVWDVVTMTKLPMVIRTIVHCAMVVAHHGALRHGVAHHDALHYGVARYGVPRGRLSKSS